MGAGSGPIGPEGAPFGWESSATPNIARIYDAWLGGKDNLAVDREIAARVAEVAPLVVSAVRANRAFVRRAVAFLAETGIEQYIDVGSGLPTGENVHEIVGRINPDARVVYVDNDPVVLVHARALLADPTRTIVVEGDVRDPARIVGTFRDVMAPGSALVITHAIEGRQENGGAGIREGARIYSAATAPLVIRSAERVADWFDRFRLVPPGLVEADAWRRTGNGRVSAPVVAGVGVLECPGTVTDATGSGKGLAGVSPASPWGPISASSTAPGRTCWRSASPTPGAGWSTTSSACRSPVIR